MTGRLAPLGADDLEQLPERCATCCFWELGAARPDPRSDQGRDRACADQRKQKQAWVTARTLERGAPGRVVRVDGHVAGFASFDLATAYAPRGGSLPRPSSDALLLATLWVDPAYRSRGIGRRLVHAALREAATNSSAAVEAWGDRRHREWDCALPASWLLHEGFEVASEHPRYPLLRLDVRRTVWDSVEAAVEGLRGRLPQAHPAPEPSAPHVAERSSGH